MSENESPSWDTKSFQMSDRDRMAQACLQAYASSLATADDYDFHFWLEDEDGAAEAAATAYRMADAMIRQSKLPVEPPAINSLRAVD